MEYKIYKENEILCLTPESKLDSWIKKIHETAAAGNVVKLYADTETTGFEYGNRGKPTYDPVIDRKMIAKDAAAFNLNFFDLEKEAKENSGKVDRIIELAFVACYTNKNGETYPLLDDDGEQIYFHEMIDPNKNTNIPENKRLKKMPMVPYQIHKTSFDFLNGNEVHPFLNIRLPHSAPSTAEVFSKFKNVFEYEDDIIFDNIILLFHNADGFDVPFMNSEIARLPEIFNGFNLRDHVQVFDSLLLIKKMLPNPIQKLVAFNQWDEFYGGDPEIKKDKDVAIGNTSKSLDNLIRFSRYLQYFDFDKMFDYQNKKQSEFAQKVKNLSLSNEIKLWDSALEYLSLNDISIDIMKDADKTFIQNNKAIVEEYKKFRALIVGFNKHLEECEPYNDIINNLKNIKENINSNRDLQSNITELNKIGRDSHGAKVDSLLFMYAFTIIENSLYKNQKIINNLEVKEVIKLPEIALKEIKKKSSPKVEEKSIKETVESFIKKNEDKQEEKNNSKTKLKI